MWHKACKHYNWSDVPFDLPIVRVFGEHSKALIPFMLLSVRDCSWGTSGHLAHPGSLLGLAEPLWGICLLLRFLTRGIARTGLKEAISPVVCRSRCGCACPFSHNRSERPLRAILYFYVCFMRNVFSCFVIIVLCGKGHLHRKWLIWWKYFSCPGLHLLPGTMLC